MNSLALLQGILPLIVFAMVDIFAGLRTAIIAAMLFSIGEALWSYCQFGEVDRLTWASLILVLLMGAAAFKMRNDKLFKFQPVVLSLISASALVYFRVFETPLLLQMFPKFAALMPEPQRQRLLDPRMVAVFDRLDLMMAGVFIVHAVLVGWAAMHKSTVYWLVMRGAGFYGLLLIVLLINLFLGIPHVG